MIAFTYNACEGLSGVVLGRWSPATVSAMSDAVPVLCESCGYDLTGHGLGDICGECGLAVADSLPHRRIGSSFQKCSIQPILLCLAWVRTNALMLGRPSAEWETVRMEAVRSGVLMVVNAIVGAVLAWNLVWFADGSARESFWLSWVWICGLVLAVIGLSQIEYLGLRTFGKKRRWRVSHRVAMAVVGHASVGWLIGLPLGAAGWIVGGMLDGPGVLVPAALAAYLGGAIGWGWVLAFAGFGIGLMVFEVLVYIGVRRCRFANPPSATL